MEADDRNKEPTKGEVFTLKDYISHNTDFLSSVGPALMGPMSPYIQVVLVVDSDTGAVTSRK
ncbi:MAG: hypothetical protein K8T10_07755 [Candidatus Eremiobacteraeota bacterium]|nr:hypothetical protein [Candidatus Eremiobacteraeota bacterium]